MALEDFGLTDSSVGYVLTDPTEDLVEKVRNRFTVLFLSNRRPSRGSYFVSELTAGRIKTNADVLAVFSLTAAQIISEMRQLSEEITPTRASLSNFTIIDNTRIALEVILFTSLGSIRASLDVVAEEETA